jgi:uncharacterized protein (DUF952 family)
MHDLIAYKILTRAEADELVQGAFTGAAVDQADGYVHLSTAAQVTETLDRHFAGQTDLHIAAVDLSGLAGAIRWEPSRHDQLFPHLYGSLTMAAVLALAPLRRDPDGKVRLPLIAPAA